METILPENNICKLRGFNDKGKVESMITRRHIYNGMGTMLAESCIVHIGTCIVRDMETMTTENNISKSRDFYGEGKLETMTTDSYN